MASKKSSGKKSSGKKSGGKKSSPKKAASGTITTAAANNALLAVSTDESAQDAKESAILQCLAQCFAASGMPGISPSAKIVWSKIPDNVIIIIGNCVRDCLTGKGFGSPGWAGPFLILKSQNKVSVVSSLVTAMAGLVTP